ncbi:MAG: glycosyltransferase family 4 protein [Candidatus Cloacimonetes bacterium]|nr:glycosyltransferase family 4 protein [Candidatus Cloacimonadota bacterium]
MRVCFIQQHPVDENALPAAILRWVRLLDGFQQRGHEVTAIGPNTRMRFEERTFRGVRQLLVPTPGTGSRALDMAVFALALVPGILIARRRFRPQAWFVDELFVAFGVLALRLLHWHDPICYDVMGVHYHQVRKNNRRILRHTLLSWLYGALEHLTLWPSTVVTTVNQAHADLLARWTRRPIHVIRDACDAHVFQQQLECEGPVVRKAEGALVLGFVGKLSNARLDDLFAVLPDAFARVPALTLLVVGDGPWGEHYRRASEAPGLAGRITFRGFVPHERLAHEMAGMDFCYSDDWSDIGFPMKVFEYMAMGMASLIEDTPAVREVMRDGGNCVLYHGRQGLLEGILRLAADPELRARIGAAALEEARRAHGWGNRIDAFETLFAQLVQTGARR